MIPVHKKCIIPVIIFLLQVPYLKSKTIIVDYRIPVIQTKHYHFIYRTATKGHYLAFKTIQYAVDQASKGDSIIIREGMYKEAIQINKNNLTLTNINNEKVIIDGNNPHLGPLIEIEASDIVINGLSVMHSSGYGIYALNPKNIAITNTEVAYSNDGGVVFVDGSHILVENCTVHHNNYRGLEAGHEAISLHNIQYFEVKNCEVFDNKEEGIDAKYGSAHGSIHHNHVYRNNGPNIYIDKANHIEVHSNIVHDAIVKAGISLNIESAWHTEGLAWTLHNVSVYNNLVYNNSGGIGFWLEYGRGSEEKAHWDSVYIINNTLVNNSKPNVTRGGGIYVVNGNPHNFGDDITIKNNIIWEKTNDVSKCIWDYTGNIIEKFNISNNVFPKHEPSDYYGEQALIVTDVKFANPCIHNYKLTPGSPAIDSGTDDGAPEFDLTNTIRPQINGIDIGAYEMIPSVLQ